MRILIITLSIMLTYSAFAQDENQVDLETLTKNNFNHYFVTWSSNDGVRPEFQGKVYAAKTFKKGLLASSHFNKNLSSNYLDSAYYSYDSKGKITEKRIIKVNLGVNNIDPFSSGPSKREEKTVYTYNQKGQLINEKYYVYGPNNPPEQTYYKYDKKLLTEKKLDKTGTLKVRSYKEFYSYNSKGQMVSIKKLMYLHNPNDTTTTNISYNDEGLISSKKTNTNRTATYSYKDGLLVKLTSNLIGGLKPITIEYSYNKQGQLTSEKKTYNDKTSYHFTFTYNKNGLISQKTVLDKITGEAIQFYKYTYK